MEKRSINEAPELLLAQDVADILGKTVATVNSMCKRGELPAAKIGKSWYVPKSLLLRKLDGERSANREVDPYKDATYNPAQLPGNDR